MIAVLVRVLALTGVYLLALTSLAPGDVLVGFLLAAGIVAAGRYTHRRDRPPDRPPGTSPGRRLAGVPALVGGTVIDMIRASWQVAGCCLRGRLPAPGLVSIPIGASATSAAAWGVRVGLAPDTIVVEIDEQRGELLLHVLDARDRDAVRLAQQDSYQRRQRRVFP
jgi:multisubunit Na+/H+ antiporter MnhE subunit